MTRLKAPFVALCLAPAIAFAQLAGVPPDGRLKKIYDSKAINVAYRTRVAVLVRGRRQEPAGYMVDLCRSVVTVIERQLGAGPLKGRGCR